MDPAPGRRADALPPLPLRVALARSDTHGEASAASP